MYWRKTCSVVRFTVGILCLAGLHDLVLSKRAARHSKIPKQLLGVENQACWADTSMETQYLRNIEENCVEGKYWGRIGVHLVGLPTAMPNGAFRSALECSKWPTTDRDPTCFTKPTMQLERRGG